MGISLKNVIAQIDTVSLDVDQRDLSRLKCAICELIMTEPTQTDCGCRFCCSCIEDIMKVEDSTQCPSCGFQIEKRQRLIKDVAVKKEISNLRIVCVYNGCEEVIRLKNIEEHMRKCDYRNERCDQCQEEYQMSKRQEHLDDFCAKAIVKCPLCGREMTRERLITAHRDYTGEDLCEKLNTECPFKCDVQGVVNLKTHLTSCTNRSVECPLKDLGCQQTGSKTFMKDHLYEEDHQMLLVSALVDLRQEKKGIKHKCDEREEIIFSECRDLTKKNSKIVEQLTNLSEKIETLARQMVDMEALIKRLRSDSSSVHHTTDLFQGNGFIVWTVRNIREEIRRARVEGQGVIVSEPFYIKRPGFKISLKIYPNGDGRSKNIFLSIFFVINQGEYDNEVSWPFRSKVHLSLLSSTSGQPDISANMKPDVNAACYGRPLSTCNVGAGQPEFVRLSDILDSDSYVHDGALKVKLSLTDSSTDPIFNKLISGNRF